MRYTWPKFKLCRREGINLFWPSKYDVRKNRKVPWQHGDNMPRLSEFWKLLRNKQVLKRMYLLTEKQFNSLIIEKAWIYAKNKGLDHDKAAVMFLERRLDSIILRAWLAKTIMQARQIVSHGHLLLNWKKHNIPSYLVNIGDKIEIRERLKTSTLYSDVPVISWNFKLCSWLSFDKSSFAIEVLDLPKSEELEMPVDILKVIEFYARA